MPSEFSFGNQTVATAYDKHLVPVLFDPWAVQLVDDFEPWEGRVVLDLATGTGILAEKLARRVGPTGRVIGADISREMLAVAEERCAGTEPPVEFLQTPAHPLSLPDRSVDVVVCQQGFQFFPEQELAAGEILRVLRPGGTAILTTWRPVAECGFFGTICKVLESIGLDALSQKMRIPFDFMPETTLRSCFVEAGFERVEVGRQERPFGIADEVHAVSVAYATPIGPDLKALPDESQILFRDRLRALISDSPGDAAIGSMASNVLVACRPA